jgi:diguanylate cyclase (GGDEF)-like protein
MRMDAAFDYENCWSELLKSSRKWQAQCDVGPLLEQVCATAQELLAFDCAAAFVLETSGVTEKTCLPAARLNDDTAAERQQTASDVIHAGRTVLVHQPDRTILCAPLTGSREILGALYVETAQTDRIVTDRDQQPLQMLATLGAASLEHALLYQAAITDPLTGLFCHRHFQQELEQAIRCSARSEQPLALILLNLDHFKELNDTSGHDAGNQCLKQVASILRATVRSNDVVARFGGDEFEVLLPDTSSENAAAAAEKIRQKIGARRFGQNHVVTATIGIASFPKNASNAEELFLNADAALYQAKEEGRDRLTVSSATRTQSSAVLAAVRRATSHQLLRASRDMPPPPGAAGGVVEKIDGHPVLGRQDVSGTGETLLVEQPVLKRTVALKRPLTPHLSPEQTHAFEQEAIITASLNHPGVIPVHSLGRDFDGRRYYTMRPLEGLTFDEILKRKARGDLEMLHGYTQERLLEILQRAAETVAYAHTRKVLHLDLNPGNVVVGKFGEVTVTNWACGSSLRKQPAAANNFRLVGSMAFAAPEILMEGGTSASAASDVFALGAILFYILSGQMPFQRASTREEFEALTKGELIPPDTLFPEAGIDPLLSELCVKALARDPGDRVSAQMFAGQLARLVRHEMDWTTIRFGPDGHPLSANDWTVESGLWELAEDHWVFNGGDSSQEGFLSWNVPVSGSFRFSCEGWIEEAGTEISIIGHRPAPDTHDFKLARGYFFQLGAEENSVTKLARHEHDVLGKPCVPLEPGRRYRLELEYQDAEGLIHCSVDNQRVFSYRELFPFSGSRIGFYAYGKRTRFKPLCVDKQNWNLQVPALRAADQTYSFGHFDEALQRYKEIAANSAKRLSGMEAKLKSGMCLASMDQREEARRIFRQLSGTIFEPFALAEEALLEAAHPAPSCMERILDIFKTLFEKFPKSQARSRIFDITSTRLFRRNCWAKSYARELEIKKELNHLAVNGFGTPMFQSQLNCLQRLAEFRCGLGQWEKALAAHQAFASKLSASQLTMGFYQTTLAMTALANNRLDLLRENPVKNPYETLGWQINWHRAVRLSETGRWLEFARHRPVSANMLMLLLSQGGIDAARSCLQNLFQEKKFTWTRFGLDIAAVESRIPGWLDLLRNAWAASGETGSRQTRLLLCRHALEGRDFEAAGEQINGLTPMLGMDDDERSLFLLQTLLSSLGFLKTPAPKELRQHQENMLAGAMLDLAKMFTGEREPVPGALWPHALWRPEWRLWLGLWLEAKGRGKEAREVVRPSREPAYGLTHCQPAIEALLKRTGC